MAAKAKQRRAIGIVRVSRVGGRDGESFTSPDEQRQRIESECEREGLQLIDVISEPDVSGGTPLPKRERLRTAIERVEAGEAQVIVAAYFDRLARSLKVRGELVDRVETAGGQVLAVDVGPITNGSAGQWLSGTLLGAVAEYHRRSTGERVAEAQVRAVDRGVPVSPRVPLGYTRAKSCPLVPDPQTVPIVRQAFAMRADGDSITAIRKMLAAAGIARSHRGVQVLLANRIYLGEVHFGKHHNLDAHEAIIDRELFDRVQRMVIPRGPQPDSDRLLARLGVLRCGSCGSRLGSMKMPRQNDYPIYRCRSTSDCDHRMTISAEIAEQVVTDHVRAALANVHGRASAETNVRNAEQELADAQDALDAAVRAFDGMGDELAVRDKLAELRRARDGAQARLDQLGGAGLEIRVNADTDWERLTLDEQRALIRATVARATVGHGRGAERIEIQDVSA